MKYFYHDGRAYSADDEMPEAAANWLMHTTQADVPDTCAKCGKRHEDIGRGGWHCKPCRAAAVRRLGNPSYVGRTPTGHNETEAMASKATWRDNFEEKIDRSGGADACHVWTASALPGGYGMFRIMGRTILAHRLSYLLAGGALGHAVVMHLCDNPKCVNPAHLRGGTMRDNVMDMLAKGRNNPSHATHLRDRQQHPRNRRVNTPRGEFPSAALAAQAFGISRGYAAAQAKAGLNGWAYIS